MVSKNFEKIFLTFLGLGTNVVKVSSVNSELLFQWDTLRVTYIVAYMGAPQYTMLIFGFHSLHTLRWYVRRRCDYCIQSIYLFIITIYFYYYNTMHRYIKIHPYLYNFLYSSSLSNSYLI